MWGRLGEDLPLGRGMAVMGKQCEGAWGGGRRGGQVVGLGVKKHKIPVFFLLTPHPESNP